MHSRIVVSVVSHGHGGKVEQLLHDIVAHCATDGLHVELTLNIAEPLSFSPAELPFTISVHRNERPCGFAANHNAAFRRTQGDFFCVMNPDVRLNHDPFPALLNGLDAQAGLIAPKVIDSYGAIQSSARELPTPWSILAKATSRKKKFAYDMTLKDVHPDWIAGICMLIPWQVYRNIGGFDERYYLYYEDVDLCVRMRLYGYDILVVSEATIVHDGAYSSHRRLKYLAWHLRSMLRFFGSGVFRAAFLAKRNLFRKGCHQNGGRNHWMVVQSMLWAYFGAEYFDAYSGFVCLT